MGGKGNGGSLALDEDSRLSSSSQALVLLNLLLPFVVAVQLLPASIDERFCLAPDDIVVAARRERWRLFSSAPPPPLPAKTAASLSTPVFRIRG